MKPGLDLCLADITAMASGCSFSALIGMTVRQPSLLQAALHFLQHANFQNDNIVLNWLRTVQDSDAMP